MHSFFRAQSEAMCVLHTHCMSQFQLLYSKCVVTTCGCWWQCIGQMNSGVLNSGWIRTLRLCDKGSEANILFMPLTDMYTHNVLLEAYRQQHGVCCDFWIIPVIESTNHCGDSWSALNVVIARKAYTRHAEKLVWNPECAYFSYPTDYLNFPVGIYSLTNSLSAVSFQGSRWTWSLIFFSPSPFWRD